MIVTKNDPKNQSGKKRGQALVSPNNAIEKYSNGSG
jgi:hypothetical protein